MNPMKTRGVKHESYRKELRTLFDALREKDSVGASKKVYTDFLDRAINAFRPEQAVRYLKAERAVIVGDLHGDTETFRKITDAYPVERHTYILMGDYVDRGKNSTELLAFLLVNKLLYKKSFIMLRGDHEGKGIYPQTFIDELDRKMGSPEIANKIYDGLFPQLPIAIVLNKKYFIVHGGIPVDVPDVAELRKLEKVSYIGANDSIKQMVWNDPMEGRGYHHSMRGAGIYQFGKDVIDNFLQKNGLDLVIRGHEHGLGGYRNMLEANKILTLITAAVYRNEKPHIAKLEDGKLEIFDMSGPKPISIKLIGLRRS